MVPELGPSAQHSGAIGNGGGADGDGGLFLKGGGKGRNKNRNSRGEVAGASSMGTSSNGEEGADTNGLNSASPDQSPFTEGERVLAYHGSLIYEAKIQKVEFKKKEWRFFVHYLGWNKNWDEWVTTDRLLKVTEENLKKQNALMKNQSLDKNVKSGRSAQIKPKSSTDTKAEKEDLKISGGRGKKRKSDSGLEDKDTSSTGKLVKLYFPSTLKKQLVDDWEFVTQLGKLVKLPRTPSVDDILKRYLDYRSKKDSIQAARVIGIRDMEEEASKQLQQKLLDFLKYLQKNQSAFFLSTYDGPKTSAEIDEEQND